MNAARAPADNLVLATGLCPLALGAADPLRGAVLGLAATVVLAAGSVVLAGTRSLLPAAALWCMVFMVAGSGALGMLLAAEICCHPLDGSLRLALALCGVSACVLLGLREAALGDGVVAALRRALVNGAGFSAALVLVGLVRMLGAGSWPPPLFRAWSGEVGTGPLSYPAPVSAAAAAVTLFALGLVLALYNLVRHRATARQEPT